MSNKFKVKKKLVSIALALALGVQPLASLPMNVFAGTGKNGVIMAPTVETNFELDNIIELKAGETFNVNDHVTNIQPEGATVSYNVESQTVFDSGEGATEVLDVSGTVQKPGIAKVKVAVGGVSKETYIIADINGMLNAAEDAAFDAGDAAVGGISKASKASYAAFDAANAAASNASDVASKASDVAIYANSAYNASNGQAQTAWNVAKKACESAKTALKEGLDLESKLKTAYMAYRVAEAVWIQFGTDQANLNKCQKIANALQKVIDRLYSDKVGDHEEEEKWED